MTEEKKSLLQRLNAVQQEVDYIQKERKQGMRYSIVSHDAVTAKVRPLMVKHRVVYYPMHIQMEQVGNRTQMAMTVRFCNVDVDTDYIDVATAGFGIDDQDKGPGKAMSYAVKYSLLKVLGLESGDDPDEDQETTHSDPANPHMLAMAQFEADIEAAVDPAALASIQSTHAKAIAAAAAVFPARVQLARQVYAKKLRELKKGD